MTRFERISKLIQENVACDRFDLTNQTAAHHRPVELETHFDLLVVSGDFQTLSRVKRQQRLMDLVKDEFQTGLHAFSIQAYTPDEFAQTQTFSPPKCAH